MIPAVTMCDRTVAVLGLGRSGRSACRALLAGGARVLAWDDDPARRAEVAAQRVPLVDLASADWNGIDRLVLSPGIPLRHPRPHPMVERARAAEVPVIGDIELLVESLPNRRIVGITGTNGKSTTTALIGALLRAGGTGVQVGGNIGLPALDLLPKPTEDIYVLELSSYQLELTDHLACAVAVLLNLSADHLDRHGGMAAYGHAKRRIFRNQRASDWAIVGVDDAHGRALAEELRGGPHQVVPVSAAGRLGRGVWVEDGRLYDALEGASREIADLRPIQSLQGSHNWQNAAAAYAAARVLGVAPDAATAGLRRFEGLAHRLEPVASLAGVRFVNDSKATNPDSAARSLASFDAIFWIAGGRPKEGGFAALEPHLGHVRHAYLIGEAAPALAELLEGRVPFTQSHNLERAVRDAAAAASRAGDARPVVLLAPACASFDQFANFEARGDAFKALVRLLALPAPPAGGAA
jgi:UDP-N-acetylmuramoylalanine--D-glutamate ligase